MRQISESDLRFILGFEIKRLGNGLLRDISSGHQETRDRAIRRAADSIMARMKDWEILVPDPQENIFADDPNNQGLRVRFPVRR